MNRQPERYYIWLTSHIIDPDDPRHYSKLLEALYRRMFYWVIPTDSARTVDGIELRNKYLNECDEDGKNDAYNSFFGMPCSVLEMMVALAMRCESDVLHDDPEKDYTVFLFWSMIASLGLIDYADDNFPNEYYDYDNLDEIIDRFLDRNYDEDGTGGLFTVDYQYRNGKDMTTVDIWYQMMYFLREVREEA